MNLLVISGLILSILLLIVHLLSFTYPMLGTAGVILWIISYIYVGIFTFQNLVSLTINGVKNKSLCSLFTIAFFFILVGINIPVTRNLSIETTQEIGCALNHLDKNADKGFNQTCLFGYPARQYLLPALPSLINRSFITLHTGGSIYFLVGLVLFVSGILQYYSYSKKGDLIVLLLSGCFFHLYYFNHFLFLFEQSIFPFSFGLMLTGIFFMYIKNKSFYPLLIGYYILLYLIYSYTPSLSLYILSIAFMIFLFIKGRRNEKIMVGYLSISSLVFFATSFLIRKDIQLTDTHARNIMLLIQDVFEAIRILFLHNNPQPVISFFLTPLFMFILISGILFLFGKKISIITWWILLTILSSVLLKGYIYYVPHFRLHRSLVTFPVFFGIIAYLMHKIEIKKMRYLTILSVLTFCLGFYFYFHFENSKTAHPQVQVIEDLKPLSNIVDKKSNFTLYFSNKSDRNFGFGNLNDTSQYFYPNMKIVRGSFSSPENCRIDETANAFIVLMENDPCMDSFNSQLRTSGKEPIIITKLYNEKREKFNIFPY